MTAEPEVSVEEAAKPEVWIPRRGETFLTLGEFNFPFIHLWVHVGIGNAAFGGLPYIYGRSMF